MTAERALVGLPRLMKIDEVAELLRCSRRSIERLIRRNELDSFKAKGRRLIPRDAVAALLDGRNPMPRVKKVRKLKNLAG